MKLWQGAAMEPTHVLLVLLLLAVVAQLALALRPPPPPPVDLVRLGEMQAELVDKFMVHTAALLRQHMDPAVGGTPQTVKLRELDLERERVELAQAEMRVRGQALALKFGHDGARQPGPQPPG